MASNLSLGKNALAALESETTPFILFVEPGVCVSMSTFSVFVLYLRVRERFRAIPI